MRTFIPEVTALLKDGLTVSSYPDTVPEDAQLPAVAWYNVGYLPERLVNGCRTPDKATFRVVVVVNHAQDFDNVLNELNALDGTGNEDLQDITMTGNNLEPKEEGVPVRRFMVDLSITAKE